MGTGKVVVGNAPVSWGVYEADRPNPPFARVLDEIAAAGYEGTELGPFGYLPLEAEALARELRSRKLKLGSSFVPVGLENPGARQKAIDTSLAVGRLLATQDVKEVIVADDEDPARVKIAGRVRAQDGWSDAQWKEAVATLHAIAKALKDELGMRVVVHHHAGTFVETPAEIDRLMKDTDPSLVGLLLDTGHAAYGGADPVEVVSRHASRIGYVHLKDVNGKELDHVRNTQVPMDEAWKRGVFCPLGEGVVDFPRVIGTLKEKGYAGWMIVEQDVVPDAQGRLVPEPAHSARKSREYLKRLGL